ncbi:unnamed protein product [Gongylonema pulchrum]|uniref:Solute carrier family 40 protein n=1 Tax=Gongylonema pulchrum TaxID=637853 RepID=A0A183CZN4_9BILA|nr:unnamed protein product [Gongylonema pulchrum]
MYAVVDQKHYKLITSYIRAAALIGKFFAYGLAQFLVSFHYGSYLLLNQISFAAVCIILGIAAALPPIPSKIIASKVQCEIIGDGPKAFDVSKDYEEKTKDSETTSEERKALDSKRPNVDQGIAAYFRAIWHHFKIFERNKIVLKWSIWWALTSCGIFQVMNYVQTLWATLQINSDTFNGITECANTLIGAVISFLVQYMHTNWRKQGELVLLITSAFIATLLLIMSRTSSVLVAYVLYVAVITIYHLLITAASTRATNYSHVRRCGQTRTVFADFYAGF